VKRNQDTAGGRPVGSGRPAVTATGSRRAAAAATVDERSGELLADKGGVRRDSGLGGLNQPQLRAAGEHAADRRSSIQLAVRNEGHERHSVGRQDVGDDLALLGWLQYVGHHDLHRVGLGGVIRDAVEVAQKGARGEGAEADASAESVFDW